MITTCSNSNNSQSRSATAASKVTIQDAAEGRIDDAKANMYRVAGTNHQLAGVILQKIVDSITVILKAVEESAELNPLQPVHKPQLLQPNNKTPQSRNYLLQQKA